MNMWETIIIIYLICAIVAWGLWIGRIRALHPISKFWTFSEKGYDTAIVRAIAGPFSIWWTFKHEDGFKYGLKWV